MEMLLNRGVNTDICEDGKFCDRIINSIFPNVLSPPNGEFSSPLLSAMRGKHMDIFDDLSERDCNVNFVDHKQCPILIHLLDSEMDKSIKIGILQRFIQYGANLNFNYKGYTPIYYANDVDILNILVLNSAHINVSDNNRGTFLCYSISKYRDDLVSAILTVVPYIEIDKIIDLINDKNYINGEYRGDDLIKYPRYLLDHNLSNEDKRRLLHYV